MFSRIYVHNFRTFVNFEWKPPRACVLVGENGAGKSALTEVLRLLQDLVVKGVTVGEVVSPSDRTAWLNEPDMVVELDVERGDDSFRYRLSLSPEQGLMNLREELHGRGGLLYRAQGGQVELFGDDAAPQPRTIIPFASVRSFLSALEPRHDNKRIVAFRQEVASMWLMKPDPLRFGGVAEEESAFLQRDLSNFASWYRKVSSEDPDAADALRADLRRALAGFVSLRFEPISAEVKDLRARFSFGGKTHELGWRMLSDGQRLLVALFGMLRFGLTKASVIALDECENFVAPSEIQPWLWAVRDATAERGQQLLVISHHPESINYMAADAAWRMWRDRQGGHSRIARLEPDLDVGENAYDLVKLAPADEPVADREQP